MDCKSGRLQRAAIYLLALISGATGVRNLEMIVPAIVKSGDSARLSCHYILEGAPLYTIQWYFGEQEFYHYLPKKLPPQVIHPLPGIDVDILHSDVNDVTLRNVTREAAGTYKCEVSEDSPTYHTVGEKQDMHVADVPETGPVIDIEKQRLPSGDTLRANCTSGASHPAPNVTWTMNGEILNATTLQFKTWTRNSAHGKLEATQSSLQLQVFSRMFHDGRLRLGCRVNISGVYAANVEMDINEDRPLIASITGDASPHSDRSSVGGHGGLSSITSSQGLIRAIIMSGSAIISIVNLR